ncbi:hypothetical protein [Ancylobacter sp.]|uniref:hypothetical protein n=1 Tax=Ancylobacter sp. TaxID=1872567 RepID=UPI003D0A7770
MDYLGGLQGTGVLIRGKVRLAPAQYDFDGYLTKGGMVTSCGEIRVPPPVLKGVFGRVDLHLRTADGRLLKLRFSEKRLASGEAAAHVDVTGDLPVGADWQRL